MSRKKIALLCLAVTLTIIAPNLVAAEESTTSSNSGKMGDENKKMMVLPTIRELNQKFEISRPTPGMGKMMSIDDQMKQLDLKVRMKEQTFRVKLSKLKDENKKNVLVDLDSKIATLSGHQALVLSDAVTRLEGVLKKVQEKTMLAKNQGANTAPVETAIANAKTALASASAAVATQSAKVYNIPVTTDEEAKQNAGQTIKQMREDIKQTRDAVMTARQAVVTAVKELAKVWKETKPTGMEPSEKPEITGTTGTVSPTMTEQEMQGMNQ